MANHQTICQTHANVTYSMANGISYPLQHDLHSAVRLNLLHMLWHKIFGFNIHQSICTSSALDNVADVACGTGLWLIEVAQEFPKCQLDGFDIDLTKAPHPDWLPHNVAIHTWDIFNDIPGPMVSKYDLVHVRLLVLVLTGLDPMPTINRFLHLVKPGGYIQWEEVDTVKMGVKKIDSAIEAHALEEICAASHAGGRHDWLLHLPDLLTEAGFEDARIYFYDDPPELARVCNDVNLMTLEEFAKTIGSEGRYEAATRFSNMVEAGHRECLKGAMFSMPRIVVVARRPL